MRTSVILAIVMVALMAYVSAEPEPPAPVYGAPVGGYVAASSGQGWGWGWRPKVRYLNLRIPIPQLPKIRLGVHAGIKASIGHNHGWGWAQ